MLGFPCGQQTPVEHRPPGSPVPGTEDEEVRPGPYLQASLHLHVQLVKNVKRPSIRLPLEYIAVIPCFIILRWLIFVLTKRFMGHSSCTKKTVIFLFS